MACLSCLLLLIPIVILSSISVCGLTNYRVRPGQTVVIKTPLYPNPYMLGVSCSWTFETQPPIGSQRYSFYVFAQQGFDLQQTSSCQKDSFRFNNGPKYCGLQTRPVAWVLPSRTVIRFVTDTIINRKGFQFQINVIRESFVNTLNVP